MLDAHSFYSLLYHQGVVLFEAADSYEAILLNEREAELLGCKSGDTALYHQRRAKAENGHVYEYTTSYTHADRVVLDVGLHKSFTAFMRSMK